MLGLALEGGGARGAFHMGAVKALLEMGYPFDGVVGTSIGALNGAIIAQGDFEIGYSWWEKIDNALLFDIDNVQLQKIVQRKIDKEVLLYLSSKLKDIIDNKGLDTSTIKDVLATLINEEKIRESTTDFGMVTVSLSDLKPVELYKEDIPEGQLLNYLMASANLPVFRLEPIEGKFYLDGGFYDNCPINLLIRKGYKEVIAIRTFAPGVVRKLKDENVKVSYLTPSEDLGQILNFDNQLIQRNLQMGYFDAMRMIKGLKGKKYYIQPVSNEKLFVYSLLALPKKVVYEIGNMMGIDEMPANKMLFEHILPELLSMLNLPSTASYQDIIIAVLEYAAQERDIDKYKIRSFSDFLQEIKNKECKPKDMPFSFITNLAEKTKLASVFAKEIIFKKVAEALLEVLKVKRFYEKEC